MANLSSRSQNVSRHRDYIWQYEYYDDEEPVSFEGLGAHRYSIVIGFWVGLAVFVTFMFFVLTLLTKIRAPDQENRETAGRRRQDDGCLVDTNLPQDRDGPSSALPLLLESQSYSHFYIQEDLGKQAEDDRFGEQNQVPRGSIQTPSRMDDMEDLEDLTSPC